MTLTMTERDKRLLMIVGCALVILACFQYMIRPALDEREELYAELDELTNTRYAWEAEIAILPGLDPAIAEGEQARTEAEAPYYTALETREIDDIITRLVLAHGLFPQSLILTEPTPGSVADYVHAEVTTLRPQMSPRYVKIATAKLEMQGAVEDWVKMLDEINASFPGLRVTGFSIEDVTFIGATGESETASLIVAELEVYTRGVREEVAA